MRYGNNILNLEAYYVFRRSTIPTSVLYVRTCGKVVNDVFSYMV